MTLSAAEIPYPIPESASKPIVSLSPGDPVHLTIVTLVEAPSRRKVALGGGLVAAVSIAVGIAIGRYLLPRPAAVPEE
jgi:hypothetical protein